MEKSFGLFFFLKQPKNYTTGPKYVYLRLTVDGAAREISTKRLWEPARWSAEAGRATGSKEDAKSLNQYLETLRTKVHEARRTLLEADKLITAEALKQELTGKEENKRTVLAVFQQHNQQMKALVGREFAPGTLERYQTSLAHTRSFIQWKYGVADMAIQQLDYEFISEYAFWLKSVRHCSHNTTMKYLSNFKKVILHCVRNGWLNRDPFLGFKMNKREVVRTALTEKELQIIAVKSFTIERLNQVKDIFLFSCYTGLAYADVKKLKRSEIAVGMDGEQWLLTMRQKTETVSRMPLLPMALEIIKRYQDHPQCCNTGKVLPVLSNQKMNAYLKEIADVCGINKNLTFHIARHTFATTITLSNGVPMETVSKMLGHKSMKQTQHYAKILDKKISEDMNLLKSKLAKKVR
ncbi:site-specific integrase [Adhaeribacter rhizoryzae]|uniref:Site-specific integrase n=1 Tax=Adhaeribacter rhizoryzae TaxID=2607907 RepID=A0A5M6DKS0_9BACT|nr:site-specific integrase [Adhaeribacter rhizoryzae]KAA5548128.1 site-specific integrase [Adhaeribacter rhizoryzae]